MSPKRFLTCAALGLAAAFPSAASAQEPINPPLADHYLQPYFLNDADTALPYDEPFGFTLDTTGYTLQDDLFSPNGNGEPGGGGPAEPNQCTVANGNVSEYANTAWFVFRAHRWGRMRVETAGAVDTVIGLLPFESPEQPAPLFDFASCSDGLRGLQESKTDIVVPGVWYATQVGGKQPTPGGTLQVKFELLKPRSVGGAAFLFWKTGPLRISDMHVKNVPAGQTLQLSCTKGACKKKRINVRSKAPLNRLAADPGSSGDVPAGIAMDAAGTRSAASVFPASEFPAPPVAAKEAVAHEAAKVVKLLRNKRVKPGAKVELRIKRAGYIGKYYRWNVKRNGISSATTRCLNPGSNKPRKRCSG
jgi:hypothetical protein